MSDDPNELIRQDQLPTLGQLQIYNDQSQPIAFSTLLGPNTATAPASPPQTSIVLFIRHFWCGLCQVFLRTLLESITPAELRERAITLSVVGCGSPRMIADYAALLAFPSEWRIYADPEKVLYTAMGMTLRTLKNSSGLPKEQRPDYIQGLSRTQNIICSIKNGPVKNIMNAGKQGDITQLGGDFIFRDGECIFAHRMRNTEDHMSVSKILELVGVKPAN